MPTRYTPVRRQFGNVLILTLAAAFAGLAPQVASALDFTVLEVTMVGYNQWYIEGSVDAQLGIEEHADIEFGGAIAGSTSTTAGGNFDYYFEAYPGETITVKAFFLGDESETASRVLEDPTGGPAHTLDR